MNFEKKCKINLKTNIIIGTIIFLVSFIIYFITKPISLSFWDCGEYITCSSILGVPHPPGNPFYIILGKFFTLLPTGLTDAQAVSLLSIVFSAFAIMFVYLSIVKLVAIWEKKSFWVHFAAIIGALFIAFSKEFWINAIEAEVYGGLSFFISLIIWLTLIWAEKSKDFDHQNILLLIVFIFFLGFGVHQTTLQIAPAILLIVVLPLIKFNKKFIQKSFIFVALALLLYFVFYKIGKTADRGSLGKYIFAIFSISVLIYYLKDYVEAKVWFFALFFIILGLSTHLILPIRASAHPFINEGDPSNLQRFMDYVFRKQYGPTSFFIRRAPLMVQLNKHFLRYFSWQFFDAQVIGNFLHISKNFIHIIGQLIVFLLGCTGIYYQYKKSKRSFIYLASLFFMASIAMILVMNLKTAEVRDRPYFFITAYMLWSFWMGIAIMGIVKYLFKKSRLIGAVGFVILSLLPVVNMASHFHKNDRSEELLSLEYGQNFLNGLDKNAIIFTNGDNDTFPLWYTQAVGDTNATEYYLEEDTIKFKEIKGYSINKAEKKVPARTQRLLNKAYKAKKDLEGIRKDISVANLSLLNTPWYIKQLRDYEGIEINLTDNQIDNLQPIQLPKDTPFRVGDIKIRLKKNKVLYVRDLMVLQIIKENFGKRPIYFAVTVADNVGFDQYLQSEGMADRLVETKGKYQMDPARLKHNIENVFDYSSIYNEDLYKDNNMKRLINNYGADFMRMSTIFYQRNDYENAIKYMEKAIEFLQDKDRYKPTLSNLYSEIGNHEKAYEVLKPLLDKKPNDKNIVYLASGYLEKAGKIDENLAFLEKFILNNPNQSYFLNYYYKQCDKNEKYKEGVEFFTKLSNKYPDEKKYYEYKNKLEKHLKKQ